MRLLFSSVHGLLDSLAPDSVSMETLWLLVKGCDKCGVDIKTGDLKDLEEYREGCEFQRQILFPFYAFDDAIGFQQATMHLAYKIRGHITEKNPTKELKLHLPPRTIQQLNAAARGRRRNILHRGLFDYISGIINDAACECKESIVWPLETNMKDASIRDMTERLHSFDGENMLPQPRGNDENGNKRKQIPKLCGKCGHDWEALVQRAATDVNRYFHGICLDCMNVRRCLREGRNPDHEYWLHDRQRMWDVSCRVRHGQPTWWVSFMGQREKRGLLAW
ncbi:hypothetical protein BJX61DRAFT_533075 [Aspergillus egyptiacus]|nr:hypothetical protein BJX61DRAFT_533075 [Aspergillus egyptiacus]